VMWVAAGAAAAAAVVIIFIRRGRKPGLAAVMHKQC
jgi:hypothetical protein